MIPVETALENIMDATYGEEVRQSIHDAISIMNGNANEALDIANIKFGTAVTSASSSTGTYPVGTIYFNTSTNDLWKAIAKNSWELMGNLKGAQGIQGEKGDKGDTGAQGEKGDKGDTGEAGSQYPVDDESTATDKVWSANKTNSEVSDLKADIGSLKVVNGMLCQTYKI